MDTKEKIERLNDHDFQMYLGVKRKTFYAALEVLEKQYAEEHKRGGKPVTISVFERLVIMLNYYCEYRTMRRLAIDYGISKTNVCDIYSLGRRYLGQQRSFFAPFKGNTCRWKDSLCSD
jgi:hypothetical protein